MTHHIEKKCNKQHEDILTDLSDIKDETRVTQAPKKKAASQLQQGKRNQKNNHTFIATPESHVA